LAGALLAAGSATPRVHAQEAEDDIVGSWVIQIRDDSGETDVDVVAFTPGGVMIAVGGEGAGVWAQTGGRSYALTVHELGRDDGDIVGIARILATVTLDPSLDSGGGTYRGTFFTLDGTEEGNFSGTFTAARVRLETM
jgi:hypothetical protein